MVEHNCGTVPPLPDGKKKWKEKEKPSPFLLPSLRRQLNHQLLEFFSKNSYLSFTVIVLDLGF